MKKFIKISLKFVRKNSNNDTVFEKISKFDKRKAKEKELKRKMNIYSSVSILIASSLLFILNENIKKQDEKPLDFSEYPIPSDLENQLSLGALHMLYNELNFKYQYTDSGVYLLLGLFYKGSIDLKIYAQEYVLEKLNVPSITSERSLLKLYHTDKSFIQIGRYTYEEILWKSLKDELNDKGLFQIPWAQYLLRILSFSSALSIIYARNLPIGCSLLVLSSSFGLLSFRKRYSRLTDKGIAYQQQMERIRIEMEKELDIVPTLDIKTGKFIQKHLNPYRIVFGILPENEKMFIQAVEVDFIKKPKNIYDKFQDWSLFRSSWDYLRKK